jgi:serine/threonine protein kinase
VRPIGHGGMGVVYEAAGPDGAERFAVKILDREHARDDKVVARFAREGRAASAAKNEHIVRVLDGGTEGGCPYLVMELLRGEDLGKRLKRVRRLGPRESLAIVDQVLQGLEAAHARGIVHRDLKPDNVILVQQGEDARLAKIVDFGMSKIERPAGGTKPLELTRKGVVLGTPLYMSPEQAKASPDLDARSDLYSVGAILFECLAGRPPHVGETYEQIMLAICMNRAPDVRRWAPEVPAEVASFVAKALETEPDARWQTAEEMLRALRKAAGAPPVDPRDLKRRARTRMIVAAAVAMVAGALVTLLAILLAGR